MRCSLRAVDYKSRQKLKALKGETYSVKVCLGIIFTCGEAEQVYKSPDLSCGGLVAWLERSTPIREIVSSNPCRGYTPVSAQVWHGVTPSGRDPWLGWGTYVPCNPSVWEAELSH